MFPSFQLFGRAIPSYWLCSLLGFIVCSFVAFFRQKKFKELQEVDISNSAALMIAGIMIGGRLLYFLTILPLLIRNYQLLLNDHSLAYEILSNGMVFYGGLFGALIVLILYIKKYDLPRNLFFDFYAPLFPLFHAFGRVGCFLTGCCHGQVSYKLGIAYKVSNSAMNGIPYFPIQLLCSLGNLVLCLFVFSFERKHHKQGKSMILYLLLYAVGRFFIEFFRGDSVRGFLFGLSTSQWISLIIVAAYLGVKSGIIHLFADKPQDVSF